MYEVDVSQDLMEFDGDYDDYLYELGELSHTPIIGPRPSHIGENVYSFEWEVLHATLRRAGDPPNALLATILIQTRRRVTQRHASVAASFITWLGTNCGHGFLKSAESAYTRDAFFYNRDASCAYLAAWAIDNRRKSGERYRIIETILAEEGDLGTDMLNGFYGLHRAPNLSVEDFETIECVVAWLATPRAKEFMARCDYLIEVRQRAERPMDTIKTIVGVST